MEKSQQEMDDIRNTKQGQNEGDGAGACVACIPSMQVSWFMLLCRFLGFIILIRGQYKSHPHPHPHFHLHLHLSLHPNFHGPQSIPISTDKTHLSTPTDRVPLQFPGPQLKYLVTAIPSVTFSVRMGGQLQTPTTANLYADRETTTYNHITFKQYFLRATRRRRQWQ